MYNSSLYSPLQLIVFAVKLENVLSGFSLPSLNKFCFQPWQSAISY